MGRRGSRACSTAAPLGPERGSQYCRHHCAASGHSTTQLKPAQPHNRTGRALARGPGNLGASNFSGSDPDNIVIAALQLLLPSTFLTRSASIASCLTRVPDDIPYEYEPQQQHLGASTRALSKKSHNKRTPSNRLVASQPGRRSIESSWSQRSNSIGHRRKLPSLISALFPTPTANSKTKNRSIQLGDRSAHRKAITGTSDTASNEIDRLRQRLRLRQLCSQRRRKHKLCAPTEFDDHTTREGRSRPANQTNHRASAPVAQGHRDCPPATSGEKVRI